MNDFDETVLEYYRQSNKPFNRFLSWEHCYEYFYISKENIDYDKAALMLFCYLASWGMLRNSFLMNHDYKLHINLIKTLIPKCYMLWDSNQDSWDLIKEADAIITDYYKNFKENNERISDTLRTKILLGIFGCVPAYDNFFKKGISKYKDIKLVSVFGENGFRKLWDFYNQQIPLTLKLHNNPKIIYPPMKLIDMYFWQIGRQPIIYK